MKEKEFVLTKDNLMPRYEWVMLKRARAESAAKVRQLDIIDVLKIRFKRVPAKVRQKVEAMTDEAPLRQALRLAITAPTMKDFLRDV